MVSGSPTVSRTMHPATWHLGQLTCLLDGCTDDCKCLCGVASHVAGKSREEVKATLKSERAKMPRRRLTNRRRTSRCVATLAGSRLLQDHSVAHVAGSLLACHTLSMNPCISILPGLLLPLCEALPLPCCCVGMQVPWCG